MNKKSPKKVTIKEVVDKVEPKVTLISSEYLEHCYEKEQVLTYPSRMEIILSVVKLREKLDKVKDEAVDEVEAINNRLRVYETMDLLLSKGPYYRYHSKVDIK